MNNMVKYIKEADLRLEVEMLKSYIKTNESSSLKNKEQVLNEGISDIFKNVLNWFGEVKDGFKNRGIKKLVNVYEKGVEDVDAYNYTLKAESADIKVNYKFKSWQPELTLQVAKYMKLVISGKINSLDELKESLGKFKLDKELEVEKEVKWGLQLLLKNVSEQKKAIALTKEALSKMDGIIREAKSEKNVEAMKEGKRKVTAIVECFEFLLAQYFVTYASVYNPIKKYVEKAKKEQ